VTTVAENWPENLNISKHLHLHISWICRKMCLLSLQIRSARSLGLGDYVRSRKTLTRGISGMDDLP